MTNPDLLRTDKGAGSKVTVGSPRTPPAASAPMLLAGCYRLEAPLGHGTASVFRARDLKTNLRYAIKRLPRDTALAAGEHDRFVSEVTLLSQLCHPHIVTMVALQRDEAERSCLVMELLEGEDMLTHLAGGQRLALPRVLAVTRQVTSALHAAHLRGIAHREFQLSSIFLAMQRGLCGTLVEVVKVVGFGGVQLRALPGPRCRPGSPGAVDYLPPEAVLGHGGELDERSDQWAVAVAVYRMLSGQLPFRAEDEAALRHQICTQPPAPLRALCPELPPHVLETLDRALAKDKAQRFPSLAEFMRALSGQTPPLAAGGRSLGEAVPTPKPSALALAAAACTPSAVSSVVDPGPPPAGAPPAATSLHARRSAQPDGRSAVPRPITMSDIPTMANKVELERPRNKPELDRTLNIEPDLLAQLREQSQLAERQPLLPSQVKQSGPRLPAAVPGPPAALTLSGLPGAWLLREHGRRARGRQRLVLILGSFLGLSIGMSAAWLLGPRATRQLRRSPPPAVAPRAQPPLAAVAAASLGERAAAPRDRLPQLTDTYSKLGRW